MLKNLKALREEYGISQQRLAEAIFVTQPSINKYENHDTVPELDILISIADYFGTTIDYIVGYSNQRYPQEKMDAQKLNPREMQLMQHYRNLDEEKQRCVDNMVQLLDTEK